MIVIFKYLKFNSKKKLLVLQLRALKARQRPTLPPIGSTIGANGLNFSVRNGKR